MFERWFDTSFEKKPLKRAFWCVLGAILLGVLMFFPFRQVNSWYPAFLFDYFDTYELGNLHNQGGWISEGSGTYSPQIVDNYFESFPKSVYNIYNIFIRKDVEPQISGTISYWFRHEGGLEQNVQYFQIQKSHIDPWAIGTAFFINAECLNNFCQFKYTSGDIEKIYAEFNIETWYKVEITWDCLTDTYTLKFGDLPVITDIPFYQSLIFADRVRFSVEYAWLDTIGEAYPPCELGNCQYCETYNSCINAGCYWYYSIYLQKYFCVEPFETEPEECGSFYKCQYCLTQETCEIELNCEWVDKGLGYKCYMIEPEIPPIQITWEVPELEDCSILEGVEKWLCEIKNFIAGIFLPSQEKMDSLYRTIMSLKDKFPFNYVNAIQIFFIDIKTELETEKSIPIKIFGIESNVDFSFWDKNVVIGGLSETLGNILLDFTSFIIILAFFVWLISFIRRIF